MSGSRDIHKAIVAAWASGSLDAPFTSYWTAAQIANYRPLEDTLHPPGAPWPRCTYRLDPGTTTDRMTSGASSNRLREVRDVPLQFTVYSQAAGTKDAKQIAAELLDEILQVFGGHPTAAPQDLSLDNGNALLTQYQTDYSLLSEDGEEWSWIVDYLVRVDVPVTV